MSGYETRFTKLHVIHEGETVATEYGFSVGINDDGAGEYVTVRGMVTGNPIFISPGEWPALRAAIDKMIGDCRE